MYKHIVFDFDGVLADSRAIACQQLNAIASTHFPGIPTVESQDDLALIFSGPLRSSLYTFGLSDSQCVTFFDMHAAAMRSVSKSIQPFAEVVEAIAQRGDGRCSIVTAAYSDAVHTVLTKSPHYSPSLFKSVLGKEHPHSKHRKLVTLLAMLRLPYDEVLYVGDMVNDILCCQSVPIDVAAVGYGYHPGQYLERFGPTYLLHSTGELSAFIRTMAA